jgi:hypothetical protein
MWENWNAYSLFVGKPERKRSLGKPRSWLLYNIKLDFGEIGWGDTDWIDLA